MSEGLGDRVVRLRTERAMAARELAMTTGISYGDLVALESGARRKLPAEQVRKLAEFFHTTADYLLDGAMPTPAQLRAGFFHYYDSLTATEREQLKFAPIEVRVQAVLRFLAGAYPTILSPDQVAARLGYTPEALADVLSGSAPLQSYLLRWLADLVGLTMDFLVRGDFFGGAVAGAENLNPAVMSQYYEVVQEAIAEGITPAELRKAVRILALRDQA